MTARACEAAEDTSVRIGRSATAPRHGRISTKQRQRGSTAERCRKGHEDHDAHVADGGCCEIFGSEAARGQTKESGDEGQEGGHERRFLQCEERSGEVGYCSDLEVGVKEQGV